jgi:ribonuclease HI
MAISGGRVMNSEFEYNGIKTNNYAEYRAIEMALGWCLRNLSYPDSAEISVFSDSELVVRQLNGEYRTKVPNLRGLKRRVEGIASKFGSVKFGNLPRTNARITQVDAELNRLLDAAPRKHL